MFATSRLRAWVRNAIFALATFSVFQLCERPIYAQFAPLCGRCQQIPARCTCQGVRPVAKTVLEQRQVVTYRDVPQVEYRTVTALQQVPKTVYRQVTVDEGGYQLVWVSRPVTRQIAQTVYETKTVQKQVPVTVIRRVPQVVQQTVPRQIVEYQPYTFTTTAMISVPTPAVTAAPLYPAPPRVGLWAPPALPPLTYTPSPWTAAGAVGCPSRPTSAATAYSAVTPAIPATPPAVTLLPPRSAANGPNNPSAATSPPRPTGPSQTAGRYASESSRSATSAYDDWEPVRTRSAGDAGRTRPPVSSRGPAVRQSTRPGDQTSPADRLARGKFVPLRPRHIR